jgi:hypothetical protein
MSNHKFLCHGYGIMMELQILEPGLGLAQVDMILQPSANAWDDSFDLYCPVK